jgi:hypothetical protein
MEARPIIVFISSEERSCCVYIYIHQLQLLGGV